MWLLGSSALFGNIFAVYFRLKEKTKTPTQQVQAYLITNLAVSDFFMGVYMIILASADIHYGDDYFIYSDQWRNGITCRIAGFLSLFSSETSVFLLTIISVDRLICGVFPFSKARFTPKSAKIIGCVIWTISFILSLVPIILAGPESDFYDLSDVCIGLPLITRPSSFNLKASGIDADISFDLPVVEDSKPAWYFSIIIFLGVNLFCFLLISFCYVTVFVVLKQSSSRVGKKNREEELRLALRMLLIVGSDFLCWVPVIFMGILSQTETVVIPLQAYTWCVVFILPINSSINPYLYTISSIYTRKRYRVTPSGNVESVTDNQRSRAVIRQGAGTVESVA